MIGISLEIFLGVLVHNGDVWGEISSPTVINNVVHTLEDYLNGVTGPSFIVDGGYAGQWGQATFPAEQPGDAGGQTSGPMGYQGVGLPFALAAKSATPERNVFLLTGDGSFGLNAVEMDTALRHGLPVVAVVVNDGAWGMIKAAQMGMYGRDRLVASELGYVRYDK